MTFGGTTVPLKNILPEMPAACVKKTRFPIEIVSRLPETVATNKLFSDTPALDDGNWMSPADDTGDILDIV